MNDILQAMYTQQSMLQGHGSTVQNFDVTGVLPSVFKLQAVGFGSRQIIQGGMLNAAGINPLKGGRGR